MKLLATLIAITFVAGMANASLVEDALQPASPGFHYQEDGGLSGDAPDTCEEVEPERRLDVDGGNIKAILLQDDDEADAFAYPITRDFVKERVGISLLTSQAADAYDITFDVVDASCGQSVLDPESPYYEVNESRIPPSDPVVPGEGQKLFQLENQEATICKDSEWGLWLDSEEPVYGWPESAYFQWSDGSHAFVDLSVSNKHHARYELTGHLGFTLEKVAMAIPDDADVQLQWLKGPCDAAVGSHDFHVEDPARSGALYAEFTVREADEYVLLVYMNRDAVEVASDTAFDTATNPPTSVAVKCDFGTCRMYDGTIDIDLSSVLSDQTL